MNKAALLSELQIRRGSGPPSGGGGHLGPIIAAIVGVVLVVAGVVWFLIARPDRMTVETATASRASAAEAAGATLLEASGYVVAQREATVSSKITGRVNEVLIQEGQHVAAGQVIARLDPSNVQASLIQARAQEQAADANLKVAEVTLANAGPKYQRDRRLNGQGWLSQQSVEDAQAAFDTARYTLEASRRNLAVARAAVQINERALDDTIVRAPFAGVITVKAAQPGEIVSPVSAGGGFTRTGIGTIVDMSSLEVEVDVAENYINRVRAGMPATVRLNAYPDWEIPAEVTAVIPTADRSKATVKVRVAFKALDPRIVPEMGAKVAFLSNSLPSRPAAAAAVEVPAAAVRSEGAGQGVVFVLQGHTLERRAVRLGARDGDNQSVLAGLPAGDQVALGDLSKMHDGMTVRVKSGG